MSDDLMRRAYMETQQTGSSTHGSQGVRGNLLITYRTDNSLLKSRVAVLDGELRHTRSCLSKAHAIIAATHKRAVTHENCKNDNCPICVGGLFVCADCGAAEVECQERVCTGQKQG